MIFLLYQDVRVITTLNKVLETSKKSCFPTWADILVLGILSFTVGTLWGTWEEFSCQECIDQVKKKKKGLDQQKKKRHRQNSSSFRTLAIFLPQSRLSRGRSLWALPFDYFWETGSDLTDSDNCPPSPLLGRFFFNELYVCEYVCVFVRSPGEKTTQQVARDAHGITPSVGVC